MRKTTLRPCPFCGKPDPKLAVHRGAGRGYLHQGEDIFSIDCMGCGASVPNRYQEKFIVEAWNTRVCAQEAITPA